jgi:hypothetical protein
LLVGQLKKYKMGWPPVIWQTHQVSCSKVTRTYQTQMEMTLSKENIKKCSGNYVSM